MLPVLMFIYIGAAILGGSAYVIVTRKLWEDKINTERHLALSAIAGLLAYLAFPSGSTEAIVMAMTWGYCADDVVAAMLSKAYSTASP